MGEKKIKIKRCSKCGNEIRAGDSRAFFNYYTRYDRVKRQCYLKTRMEFCQECWEKIENNIFT